MFRCKIDLHQNSTLLCGERDGERKGVFLIHNVNSFQSKGDHLCLCVSPVLKVNNSTMLSLSYHIVTIVVFVHLCYSII